MDSQVKIKTDLRATFFCSQKYPQEFFHKMLTYCKAKFCKLFRFAYNKLSTLHIDFLSNDNEVHVLVFVLKMEGKGKRETVV